jgi:BirA family transcriptional regulator, biotin operon repressor / biotin---[acetyl-CoA-carboxylase] ligase
MSLLKSTLSLLADGQFHSETEISHFLGLPSSILSETLIKLLESGINLEKQDNKGYRIPGGLELLNEKLIFNELGPANQLLNRLEILTSIDSTNNYLLAKTENIETAAVFAERQTAGRGQFNRAWISESLGKNIALSISYHLPNKPNKLTGLSLIVGLAVVQALEEYGLKGIKLKWPNDIVYQDKKLAGILIEARLSKPGFYRIVTGIGLNIYTPTTNPHIIKRSITDICSIQNLPPQRNRLAGLLLKKILITLAEFRSKGFPAFIMSLEKLDSLKGKFIQIQTASNLLEGIANGINSQGQLRIDIDGKPCYYSSGEIRIQLNHCTKNC